MKLVPTCSSAKNGLRDAQIKQHLTIAKFVRAQAKLCSDKADKKMVKTFASKNPPSIYQVGEHVLVNLYGSKSRRKSLNKYTRVITGRIENTNVKQGRYKVCYELSGKELHGWFKVTALTSLTKCAEKSKKSMTALRNLSLPSITPQPERVPSKSDVTELLQTHISTGTNTGKFAIASRVKAIFSKILSAVEIWNDLYDVEKISLLNNATCVTKIIGMAPPSALKNQLAVTNERPFMQFQGSTSYCGVSVLNNALQYCAVTVEKLNDIADNQWLQQIEDIGLTICDELQQMRDTDGNYSVDVLKQATEDLGYEMVHLDNEIVTNLRQHLDTTTTLNQLSGLITHRGPKSIIVADSRGEGIPHYSTILFSNSAVWHLNSLSRRPNLVSKTWMMTLLKDTQVARSKVCLYTLQPLQPIPHSPAPSFEEPNNQVSPSTVMDKYPPTASILVPPASNNSLSSASSIVYVSPLKPPVHGQLPVNECKLLEKGMLVLPSTINTACGIMVATRSISFA